MSPTIAESFMQNDYCFLGGPISTQNVPRPLLKSEHQKAFKV